MKEKREREREENASDEEEDHRSLTVEPRRGRRGRHFTALLQHPRIQRQREVRLEIGISREGSSGKRGVPLGCQYGGWAPADSMSLVLMSKGNFLWAPMSRVVVFFP